MELAGLALSGCFVAAALAVTVLRGRRRESFAQVTAWERARTALEKPAAAPRD